MTAVERLRAKIAALEAEKDREVLRLCSKFRAPGESAPSVEEVHAQRQAIDLQLRPLKRRLAILEAAMLSTSIRA